MSEEKRRHTIESRYWIALALCALAAVAVWLALVESLWLIFAAIPPALGAALCAAPRSWLASARYRRFTSVLAYASIVPAAIALAAAVGFVTVAVIALPLVATFVIVTRLSGASAPR